MMMDIDKIVNKIIRLLKNDYLFDVDDEEEYAIKSDIADILQGEYNELRLYWSYSQKERGQ